MEGGVSYLVVFLLFAALAAWLFVNINPAAGIAIGAFAVLGMVALAQSA